ncbi:MAG: cytochrome c3 family protein [candidate division WOR-3 bacterium]
MKLFFFLILLNSPHDFRNREGERICKFCHSSHNSKGPFLIKIIPDDELKENFKDFDYVSLTCMNCHTDKNYLINLYSNIAKFYEIPDTSSIFLGINYKEDNHPIRKYAIDEKEREIKCTTCHDPHERNYKYLLRSIDPIFCEKCHLEIELFSGKHLSLACIDCHKLHRGKSKLLKNLDLCNNCHKIDFHFEGDDCIKCHNPHKPEVKR